MVLGRTNGLVTIAADDDDAVVVTVTDDGHGFDPTVARPGHLGLTSMRERATAVGADLQLSTAAEAGTSMRLTVPADRNDPQSGVA